MIKSKVFNIVFILLLFLTTFLYVQVINVSYNYEVSRIFYEYTFYKNPLLWINIKNIPNYIYYILISIISFLILLKIILKKYKDKSSNIESVIYLVLILSLIGVSTYIFNNYKKEMTLLLKREDRVFIEKEYYKIFKETDFILEKNINNYFVENNQYIYPNPNNIVNIDIDTLGENIPNSKDDGSLPVIISFEVDDLVLKAYGTIKVQGSSTARWPKKNWTINIFKDEERKQPIDIKIGDSIPSNKWIAKADWNDPTMLRNALSYRLWGEIVNSRDNNKNEVFNGYNSLEMISYAKGYPQTHPVHIKINEEHYGLSLLTLGHDPNNFNLDKNNPKHVYMEFDARYGYTLVKTWEKFRKSGIGQWIEGYYPENKDLTDEQKDAIDEVGKIINGSIKEFGDNFHTYFDKDNIIDMILFYEMVYDYDAVAQDIEIVTYDLKKWYFLPWDKDTTFGMDYFERGVLADSEEKLLLNYETERSEQKLWYKTYVIFKDDIEERYKDLRDKGIFSLNKIIEMSDDVYKKIPSNVWEEEVNKWKPLGRPALNETSKEQILEWFEKRLELLDKHFNYIK